MGTVEQLDLERLEATARVEEVPIKDLDIDRSYQKDPSQTHVDRIAEDYDSISSELILVSDRGDGKLFIVNGQHRTLAATKMGRKTIWARIIDTSSYDDPAVIEAKFRLRTNVRNPDKSVERFKAQLRSGNQESVRIVEIVSSFDSEINYTPNPDTGINAVTSLERIFRYDDTGDLLSETLSTLKSAFGHLGGQGIAGNMLVGTAWFLIKHAGEADRYRLIEKMSSAGTAAIMQRARNIGSSQAGVLWMHTYRALVDFYNERLTDGKKLEWRLRGSSNFKSGPKGGINYK